MKTKYQALASSNEIYKAYHRSASKAVRWPCEWVTANSCCHFKREWKLRVYHPKGPHRDKSKNLNYFEEDGSQSILMVKGKPYRLPKKTDDKLNGGEKVFKQLECLIPEEKSLALLRYKRDSDSVDSEFLEESLNAEVVCNRRLGRTCFALSRQKRVGTLRQRVTEHYILMEKIPGEELFDYINDHSEPRKLSFKKIITAFMELAEKYQRFIDAGYIPLDIKPSNILYEETATELKLHPIDFGISEKLLAPSNTIQGAKGYLDSSSTTQFAMGFSRLSLEEKRGIRLSQTYFSFACVLALMLPDYFKMGVAKNRIQSFLFKETSKVKAAHKKRQPLLALIKTMLKDDYTKKCCLSRASFKQFITECRNYLKISLDAAEEKKDGSAIIPGPPRIEVLDMTDEAENHRETYRSWSCC